MLTTVSKLAKRGVIVHAGSEALAPGCSPGAAFYTELLLLKECGFSDEEVLCSATVLPGAYIASSGAFAQLLGVGDQGKVSAVPLVPPPSSSPSLSLPQPPVTHHSASGSLLPPALPTPQQLLEESNGERGAQIESLALDSVRNYSAAVDLQSSLQALRTLKASRLAWLGFLVEGGLADMVISRVDPRGDLCGALDSLVAVVAAGRVYYMEDLNEKLLVEWSAKDENLSSQITQSLAPFLQWKLF